MIMQKPLKFVFAVAAILLCGFFTSISGVEFGKPCDTDTVCNATKHLACNTETDEGDNEIKICGCRKKGQMYFEPKMDTCVVIVNSQDPLCIDLTSGGHLLPTPCTPNAICNAVGIDTPGRCFCDAGSIPEANVLCKLGHGMGNCSSITDCARLSAFLKCGPESKCICEDENSIWNEPNKKCTGLVGGKCDTERPCVQTDTERMACEASLCKCVAPYEDVEGRCLSPLYGDTCQENADCHPKFPHCAIKEDNTKSCQCPLGQEHIEGKCVILLDELCNQPEGNMCKAYSHCDNVTSRCQCDANYSPDSDNKYCNGHVGAGCSGTGTGDCHTNWNLECVTGVCACKANFIGTGEGKCLADHGTDCTSTPDCHPNFVCLPDFKCECPLGSRFDDGSKKCHILAGENCTLTGTDDLCFAHSSCKDSVCECDDKYSSEDGICKGNLGAGCTIEGDDCNSQLYLTCDNATSTCNCAAGYNLHNDICLGEVNSTCKDHANCESDYCLEMANGGLTCSCLQYSVPVNKKCMSTYGGSCSKYACYGEFGLECEAETQECKCVADKYYAETKNGTACINGVGGPCDRFEDCVENSNCIQNECRCIEGYRAEEGICRFGGGAGGGVGSLHKTAFLAIALSIVIAIANC